jgi:hypothetical protein
MGVSCAGGSNYRDRCAARGAAHLAQTTVRNIDFASQRDYIFGVFFVS